MSDARPWTLRTAAPADADRLATMLHEGFESYRSFAPPDWEPPAAIYEPASLRERLADPDVWCLLAEAGGEPAGHVALLPAAKHSWAPSTEPGLAQLWPLFVRPPW
jgi:predicted N-acetyltransferase YhbS